MQRTVVAEGAASERVYSVVFRTNAKGGRFEVLSIVGERKTPDEIIRDLRAAVAEMELRGGRVNIDQRDSF